MPWAKGQSGNPSGRPKNSEASAADPGSSPGQALTARRLALRASGYAPIPLQGKDGLPSGWTDKGGASEEEVASWTSAHPYKTNTGALTRYMPTIDSDITRPDAADAVAETVRDWFDGRGVVLTRFGQAPKRANLFRTDAPFKKLRIDYIDPPAVDPANPKGPKGKHHIEILGDGQQVIVDGVHPVTKQPYSWHGGYTPWSTPRSELPELNEGEALVLLEHITEMLVEQFGFQIDPGGHGTRGNGSDGDPPFRGSDGRLDVDAALAAMQPTGVSANDIQPSVILSLLQKAIHPDDVIVQVVDSTMETANSAELGWTREKEAKDVLERCKSGVRKLNREYDPSTGTVPSWLAGDFHPEWVEALRTGRRPELIHASHIGWHVRSYAPKTEKAQEAAVDAPAEEPQPQPAPPKGRIYPKPFSCFDFTKIPQREWLYGGHYMRSIASATIGPGGSGKSSLDLVESIAMSTARNLLGEQPTERLRVWYHNGEDPLPELERRVAAICVYYKIDPHELDGYFFCTSGLDMPIKIAGGNGEVKLNHATAGAIIAGIREREIDVLTLDPLITLHSLAEAENHKMDPVLREFARIANDTNCAIELAHHTRKKVSGQDDYTTADARGASAIIDAVRSARTLNGLNNDDAKLLGIDDELERLSYFRVDKGKANMTRRSAARYYKLVGQELPNGLAGGPGDDVGVVTRTVPPRRDHRAERGRHRLSRGRDGQLGPGREGAVRKLVRVRRRQASRPRRGQRPRPR